jgi:tetratricopeptide (TPR) repeat protein
VVERRFISRFTPSRTRPEDLEAILVQRQGLLEDAVERTVESIRTKDKHQLLFVGPRGSGKTHFVSLLFHRLDSIVELHEKVCVAWLNEDESTTSVLDLLLRIMRALEKKYPKDFSLQQLDALHDLAPAQATERLLALLFATLRRRALVVIVENLDEVFLGLGRPGQHELRAIVQNHPVFCFVATSSRLFEGVRRRESPFFGFFQTEHLAPLSVPEAVELFGRIAHLSGQADLAAFLETPAGHARIRVLHHLAGGNQRLHVVLSEFITRDSIEELVGPLESMIDELTPYYQDRLRALPPQQRKIVEALAFADSPEPVKAIARRIFATQQTVAGQLKHLKDAGFVESNAQGRESYYELSEPLMRLSLRVKESQPREPLHLLVEFLRHWYDQEELEARLDALSANAAERPYLELALASLRQCTVQPRINWLLTDLERLGQDKMGERIELLRALVAERGTHADRARLITEFLRAERPAEALVEADDCLKKADDLGADQRAALLLLRGTAEYLGGDALAGVRDQTRALEVSGISSGLASIGNYCRALLLETLNRNDEAIVGFGDAIARGELTTVHLADAYWRRAVLHSQQKQASKAVADFSSFIDLAKTSDSGLEDKLPEAYFLRGLENGAVGDTDGAVADLSTCLKLEPRTPFREYVFFLRGLVLQDRSKPELALLDLEQVTDSAGPSIVSKSLATRARIYSSLERHDEALASWSSLIVRDDVGTDQLVEAHLQKATHYIAQGRFQEAEADLSAVVAFGAAAGRGCGVAFFIRGLIHTTRFDELDQAIADFSAALSHFDPSYGRRVAVLISRAETHVRLGSKDAAARDYTEALETPGAERSEILRALHALVEIDLHASRWQEGLAKLDRVLSLGQEPEDSAPSIANELIGAVLRSGLGTESWRPRIDALLALYARHAMLGSLGDGLIRSLNALRSSGLDATGYQAWRSVWQDASEGQSALVVPMRLFSVGIEWLSTRNARTLLRLPKEERTILRQTLQLTLE